MMSGQSIPDDELSNPKGVAHFGLTENKSSMGLAKDWYIEGTRDAILSRDRSGGPWCLSCQKASVFQVLK